MTWYRSISGVERRTFWACFGGWSLDALDLQMFSLVIPAIIATWHLSKTEAGLVGSVTLVAASLGGWLGGAAGRPHRPRQGAANHHSVLRLGDLCLRLHPILRAAPDGEGPAGPRLWRRVGGR